MAEKFKVWIEIERINEEENVYEETGYGRSIGEFNTEEEAIEAANNL